MLESEGGEASLLLLLPETNNKIVKVYIFDYNIFKNLVSFCLYSNYKRESFAEISEDQKLLISDFKVELICISGQLIIVKYHSHISSPQIFQNIYQR